MESENGSGAIAGSDSIVPGVDKGAALLLVIGEPSTEDEKTQILGEITRGRWHQIYFFSKVTIYATIVIKIMLDESKSFKKEFRTLYKL